MDSPYLSNLPPIVEVIADCLEIDEFLPLWNV